MRNNKRALTIGLVLINAIIATILAACGTPSGNGGSSNNGNSAFSPGNSNSLPRSATIALKHSPIGVTDLSWDPDSLNLTVKITLTGLAPNSPHAAHIHAGTCPSNGAVIYPLTPLVANAAGDATSETVIKNVKDGIPANGWYVNVHNGTNVATSIEGRAISCANVINYDSSNKSTQKVHLTMKGTTAPNENASGNAQLKEENGKPVLIITLNGLEPNSTHVAHIHSGSCAAQGPVVTMLSPVVANGDGIGTSKTIITKIPSLANGLYVNVHTGAAMGDLQQATLFNPIACGNIPLRDNN